MKRCHFPARRDIIPVRMCRGAYQYAMTVQWANDRIGHLIRLQILFTVYYECGSQNNTHE